MIKTVQVVISSV